MVRGNEYLLSHVELKYFSQFNVKLDDIETEWENMAVFLREKIYDYNTWDRRSTKRELLKVFRTVGFYNQNWQTLTKMIY